jgi:CHRD domain-containing protein
MQIRMLRTGIAGLAFAAFLSFPAAAQMVNLKADLKGSNEVPPVATSGTGSLTATYDPATKKITWKGSQSGLSGNPTAQHFHGPAAPTANAGVVVPIPNLAQGEATLTEAQAADLLAGRWYVNVHTAANPGGEIRGQVTP